MLAFEARPGFEFQNDRVLHDEIGAKVPDLSTVQPDGNACLLIHPKVADPESVRKCLLIHRLNESVAELVVDLVKRTDDTAR